MSQMFPRKNPFIYERMLRNVLPYVAPRGYSNVKANLPEQEPPDKIGKYMPSITADGLVIEVETKESLKTQTTQDVWKAFAEHTVQTQGRFVVVVPKGQEDIAKQQLKDLQITADVWTAA
jgi:hypothetical protein